MSVPTLVLGILDALEEPALLVSGERTEAANSAARALLGPSLVGQNVRFAIRQPQALDAILQARAGRFEVLGIGGVERSFEVVLTNLDEKLLMVRLLDRSARRAAEKAQIDFVANASHELRTPLAAVLGFSETLADETPLPEAVRQKFGGEIHAQANRMMVIIRDLMSLSRIEADRFSTPASVVDMGAMIQEAARAASPLAEQQNCTIELALDDNSGKVRGDPAQLRQLLDNLIGNALRYGRRPEGTRVRLTLEGSQDHVRLLVRDWGEGISAEHLPRLTERFYRVDSARSRDSGGTGLGLAIVAQIVERHRGLLQIRSWIGEGTEFEVTLPRV